MCSTFKDTGACRQTRQETLLAYNRIGRFLPGTNHISQGRTSTTLNSNDHGLEKISLRMLVSELLHDRFI